MIVLALLGIFIKVRNLPVQDPRRAEDMCPTHSHYQHNDLIFLHLLLSILPLLHPTCTSIHTIETYIHLLNYYYYYNRGGQTDGQIHYIYLNFYLKILFIVMKKIKRIGDLQKNSYIR